MQKTSISVKESVSLEFDFRNLVDIATSSIDRFHRP